jgi:hypothetical protein
MNSMFNNNMRPVASPTTNVRGLSVDDLLGVHRHEEFQQRGT